MKRYLACVLLAVVFTCWGIPIGNTTTATAQNRVPGAKGRSIRLKNCRIKLIDQVTLASDLAGILAFVEPREGDVVKAKQHIAGLRDDVAQAAFARAEKEAMNNIEIRYARKAADVAKIEHEKALEANDRFQNAIPEIEVTKLKLAWERSVLQIEQADNQFEIAKLRRDEAAAQLMMFHVEAPFDGIVTRVFKSKGEAVRQGDPILELVSTSRVRVEGYISIRDAWSVKQGDQVMVQLDVPDVDLPVEKEKFEGRISFVDPAVQPVTQQVLVWAEVENRDNILRAGLTARMTIVTGSQLLTKTAAKNSK